MAKAPRHAQGRWSHRARGAWIGVGLWLASLTPVMACVIPPLSQPGVVESSIVTDGEFKAWYADLSDRYGHAVLGDALEPTSLHFLSPITSAQCGLKVALERPHVFEDVAPRLFDLTGDGVPELITVRSHEAKGAQVAVYQADRVNGMKLLATTPYIGTRNRWLAPVAIDDLDGDGAFEIAFVDRPHLARTLRVWRYRDGTLTNIANLQGLTNHRIGEDYITGGLRDCGQGPEMIVVGAFWQNIMRVTLSPEKLSAERLAPFNGRASVDHVLNCG